MIEELRNLIELQRIDSDIVKKTDLIESIPRKISVFEKPLKEAKLSFEKAKQKYESIEKKKKDKERLLDEINEKIKKLKARTSEIKTNKEYQAHLKEIESAERETRSVEDDILSLMELLDNAHKELKSEEEKLKNEEAKLRDLEKGLKKETEDAQKEIDQLRAGRADIARKISPDLYKLYISLLETKNGLAVTEVRDGICQGCNMSISPQLYVEIKKNDEIYQCPQCRRILYWKAAT
ncbi:MAG: zinc ribbon domain-containing protein [Thermodesulfovibrionales bacterium]